MGLTSPQAPDSEQGLQVIVDQQSNAIQLLHEAFAAERQVWSLEKDRLYQRIASLEKLLLKTRDHYSPAKSPILSPLSGASTSSHIISPQARAVSNASRLPVIAEDENLPPLSTRRDGAPSSIDLPGRPAVPNPERSSRSQRESNISFDDDIKVEEIPISPPSTSKVLSPPPASNLVLAGHTPLKAPRPPTPPPQSMLMDGMEDTPTRHNTHINTYLVQSNDEEEDVPLTGPLSMPELPNKPEDGNFTLEVLSKRLEQVAQSPEDCRPTIFAQPSPGMVSPTVELTTQESLKESSSQPGSLTASAAVSPTGAPAPPPPSHEVNGVRLKKKPSVNFGAPFGQLGSFGGRKLS
ncbi:hypothetical protein BAUCODRAFT_64864 [Baudoinia panamericana UAMH 10762]|uniref:Uncharacterized protein n=1 Tax=Baudoinia panamericana (strain UAMH 10762) TaxID=717646 RepID=M2NIY9_BAUPA|nr:uncharacterized protein BAUCODRAFT_64864 [Baudoinia panamericana UAMH 10762]EMC99060.1 hypothetical protein BAUCODRAFT_64864 [Baudoinia panamericana UAMH 10762]